MREICSGEKAIPIKASNMSRFFYFQEFQQELDKELDQIDSAVSAKEAAEIASNITPEQMSALMQMKDASSVTPELLEQLGISENPRLLEGLVALSQGVTITSLPVMLVMKVVWAMHKTAKYPKEDIKTFHQWVEEYADFDFSACFADIYEEAKAGFFRT